MPKLKRILKYYKNRTARKTLQRIEFRTVPGEKHVDDRILQLRTNGKFVNIRFLDVLKILDHFFKNEDIVYSHAGGRSYLFRAIKELFEGKSIEEVYSKYRHKKLEI